MSVWRIEIIPRENFTAGESLADEFREAGLRGVRRVTMSRIFLIDGGLTNRDVERLTRELLCDPVTERFAIAERDADIDTWRCDTALEVHPRPGVMDPVAMSTLAELQLGGFPVNGVRTARRYLIEGDETAAAALTSTAGRVLANDCIEEVVIGTAGVRPAPAPPIYEFRLMRVPIRDRCELELERLSREAHLFLSLEEMRAIQVHFRELGREPTDVEIETLAQTWSEHCVHKTLKSAVSYRGAAMPGGERGFVLRGGRGSDVSPERRGCGCDGASKEAVDAMVEIRYENLLKETIARVTHELIAEGRGPVCLSVFKDNAGVIAFDKEYGIAFKVETHNHPSAIEPYGGAATGVGGCIRDVIGCGLGARPIANTDVFCVGPGDWPNEGLPRGVLHPRRVLRGVVRGVADYGNRMGIPTVNGAVYFDPRYLGNPLVYCGCVGLIPRDRIEKAARRGDLIVVVGGRTGRDGIHGATFSSAELTDSHADEFSHAVQIGNAITEKRVLDAVMRARGDGGSCLYTAITDCGAGGLSSAVGEMGAEVGAVVDLENVPLKYAGLRHDEIWISEAQERMVLAVPAENWEALSRIMGEEEVEATVIGRFDEGEAGNPRLIVRFNQTVVGDLEMRFLHEGVPRRRREAEWRAADVGGDTDAGKRESNGGASDSERTALRSIASPVSGSHELMDALLARMRNPSTASKEWIIRKYDHEVQGGSVVKPLCGRGGGPADAAVLRPRLGGHRAFAIGCGLSPKWGDIDPYWMAAAAIDEAIRNVVCVGGDPEQTALLDNFCWGRTDDARQMGSLVRACQACYDSAKAHGAPFISGKDSLNNEFALDGADVEPLIETIAAYAARDADYPGLRAALPAIADRIRATRRIGIPPTLLISAVSIVPDARRCVTSDLKAAGRSVLLVGGLPIVGHRFSDAARVHRAISLAISSGLAGACHDVSDGGWLVSAAEMAIAGMRGLRIDNSGLGIPPFDELAAAYVVEAADSKAIARLLDSADVPYVEVGRTTDGEAIEVGGESVMLANLRSAWNP